MRRGARAAATPTAMVAGAVAGRRRRRRRARKPAAAIDGLTRVAHALPDTVARAVPRKRRSRMFGRRRHGWISVARHAGTAVSAIGFAAELLDQVNTLAASRSGEAPGSPSAQGSRSGAASGDGPRSSPPSGRNDRSRPVRAGTGAAKSNQNGR